MSSRYGSSILNRDSAGSGTLNYPLPFEPVTLARMRSIFGFNYRYAGLTDGSLWRQVSASNVLGQGPYTEIASSLSGKQFTALVNNCIGASEPFLFIYDSLSMLKDSGTGSPTGNGIYPPTQPVISTPYAPQISLIDHFGTTSGYTISAVSAVSATVAFTVAATLGTSILNGDYEQYTDSTGSYTKPPDGMIATSLDNPDNAYRLKFNTFPVNNTYSILALNNVYTPADSFVFTEATWSIAASTTGYIGKSIALDLSDYQGDDLIVIALKVSNPECIQEIRVQFDVNGSGYGASYYYKSLIPVSYQGNLSLPQTNDPESAMVDAVFDSAMGITNWKQQVGEQVTDYPTIPTGLQSTQPSQIGSGEGSWSVIYVPKGQFQPAGNAGQSGADWSKITGWRVQVTTSDQGSSNVSLNGLYIQGSPTANGVGTNAGASSYGGVGYDFRYTYFDSTTLTESNGSGIQYFSVTPTNPGGQSLLIVLRQAIDLLLQYSADPQVTHVRIYARGGVFGNNWYYADQVPNVTGTSQFHYQYILPDSALEQGNILSLTNDVPVTSTLPNPIATTLVNNPGPSPANTNTPTLQTIDAADSTAVFVPYQIVDIGTPQNLEQVYVVTGGVGTFTAYIQLPHGGSNFLGTMGVTSGTNDGSGTWANPGSITTADGVYATVSVTGSSGSLVSSPGYLQGKNCGLSVPNTQAIAGIQVDVLGFNGPAVAPTASVDLGSPSWTNLSAAYDGNINTSARVAINRISGQDSFAWAKWYGFPAIPPGASSVVLNVSIGLSNNANTPGSFYFAYSIDGGSTWIAFPGVPNYGNNGGLTVYSVPLSTAQDMTRVQLQAQVSWISGLPPVIMNVSEIWASVNSPSNGQFAVQLMKAGVKTGNVYTQQCPTANSYVSFGGPTDLWGTTWLPADVNDTNFGAALQAQINNLAATLDFSVDYIRVKVYGSGSIGGEPVAVYTTPGQPLNLAALAYGQVWMAGDPNNPHCLYYTPRDLPQYCPPQNRLPIGTPTDPITAVVNHRGILFVRTYSTWYQISPGSPPTYQSTGSKHGSPANFDWCLTESEILYQSFDGIRSFRGADGVYMSLIIEWLYRNNPQSLVVPVDTSQLGSVISGFKNNTATFSYIGTDGKRHRLRWSHSYKRWRNDDVPMTACLVEPDTNLLVYAIPYPGQSGYAIVYEDISLDYDDGGWGADGKLVKVPIDMDLQLPYLDLGSLNNQKQFNVLTIDADPNNQIIDVQLLFDDDNGNVAPINLGSFTGSGREKFQFIINAGEGQEAYRISPKITASVAAAPIIYQANIEAAVLADQRNSYDSYWQKFGTDESKLAKQGYFDYSTSNDNPLTVQLFADGEETPYYSFVLPSNDEREEVPMRVRFPAIKFRLWRIIVTSPPADGSFRLWTPIQIDVKPVKAGSGYQRAEITEGLTP